MNRLLKLEKIYVKNFNYRHNIDHIFKNNNIDGVYYNFHKFITNEYSLNKDIFYDVVRINDISGYLDVYIDQQKVHYKKLISNHFSSGRKIILKTQADYHNITTPVKIEYTGYIFKKYINK